MQIIDKSCINCTTAFKMSFRYRYSNHQNTILW